MQYDTESNFLSSEKVESLTFHELQQGHFTSIYKDFAPAVLRDSLMVSSDVTKSLEIYLCKCNYVPVQTAFTNIPLSSIEKLILQNDYTQHPVTCEPREPYIR